MTSLKQLATTIFFCALLFILLAISTGFMLWQHTQQSSESIVRKTPVLICGNSRLHSEGSLKGKHLFNTNCAACHNLNKRMTGPALRGTDSLKLWLWFRTYDPKFRTNDSRDSGRHFHYNFWKNSINDEELGYLLDYIEPNH